MKLALFWPVFIVLLAACSPWARRPASILEQEAQHIVFDIDWTIVSEIKDQSVVPLNSKRTVTIDGQRYFIAHGLESFIERLLAYPEIKISFFSGGKGERNKKLLAALKLGDGRSLLSISHKVLSREDLVEVVGANEQMRFAERFKKDLTKVSEHLDNILMFDDTPGFVLLGKGHQQDQVFFIGSSYLPFENYEDAKKLTGDYVPPSRQAWLLDQNRLVLLKSAFEEAYEEWKEGKGNVTLAQIMKRKESELRFDLHQWNAHSRRLWKKSMPGHDHCRDMVSTFFKVPANLPAD